MEFRAGLWNRPGLQSETMILEATLFSAKLLSPPKDIPRADLTIPLKSLPKLTAQLRDLGFGSIKNTPHPLETLLIYPFFSTLLHLHPQMTATQMINYLQPRLLWLSEARAPASWAQPLLQLPEPWGGLMEAAVATGHQEHLELPIPLPCPPAPWGT